MVDNLPDAMEVPLIMCSILLPKAKISCFPKSFATFLAQISHKFSGWSMHGEASGNWQGQSDISVIVKVAIDLEPEAFHMLRKLVANLAAGLNEQCIFIEYGHGSAFMVWASLTKPTDFVEQLAAPTSP